MKTTDNYLAVDLGATSGRTILATLENGKLEMEELTRFANPIIHLTGHCFWDIYALYNEIIAALRETHRRGISLRSIGIDTWGVDFVMFGKDGLPLGSPFCYRDNHTDGEPERFFEQMPAEDLYALTGIQVMNFNSLFQLSALRRQQCSALEAADKLLFIPDALSYMLTGQAVTEYTVASTSQLLDARQREFAEDLLQKVGLTRSKFGRMVQPGEQIGTLSPEIQQLTGLGAVPVIAVAGHDTASAVAAVPAEGREFAYLSSGTWSLMGIESDEPIMNERSCAENFTNEGGVEGTIRFLKNICGLWLLERCRSEWEAEGQNVGYAQLIEDALKVTPFRSLIFPDAVDFANPLSMPEAIRNYCQRTHQPVPETPAEMTRCIFDSLALRYRQVFELLKSFSARPIRVLHIIGGGSRNQLLNQFTANAIGCTVIAGPSECTALGNLMFQAKADGKMANVAEMRRVIAANSDTVTYQPADSAEWEAAYQKFETIINSLK
jgi:rhamnulokinase